MPTGLESATLWALQLGTAIVALMLMFLFVCATAGFTAWCLFRMKRMLESELRSTRYDVKGVFND